MIIEDWDKLTNELNELKSQGKRIIFTNGCFDILHFSVQREWCFSKVTKISA